VERIAWDGGAVSAEWHEPAQTAGAYLTLAHGAGGSLKTPQLARLAAALAERGLGVVRFNFPYAERGRKTPGSPKESVECYRGVATAVGARAARLFLGGKSYGGRMASILAADGHPCDGIVFFGYPLHAPGKTDRLRDEHLSRIVAPMLFLQGTRDAFARLDLIERTVSSLPAAALHVVDGADHSFTVAGRAAADVVEELAAATAEWMKV
jgi:hypothetical protein